MEGGKLQGRYPEEDTGQYTQFTAHKTRHNAAFAIATLSLWYYKYKIVNWYLTPYKKLNGYPASLGFLIMHRVGYMPYAPNHNRHHIKSCYPSVKQYIKTHRNTESIISSARFLPPLFPSRRPCPVPSLPRSFPSSILPPSTLSSSTDALSLHSIIAWIETMVRIIAAYGVLSMTRCYIQRTFSQHESVFDEE